MQAFNKKLSWFLQYLTKTKEYVEIDVVAALEDAMHLFDVAEGRIETAPFCIITYSRYVQQ